MKTNSIFAHPLNWTRGGLTGLLLVYFLLSCKDTAVEEISLDNSSPGKKGVAKVSAFPANPVAGQLLFGSAESGGSMGSFGAFETALQNNGADPGFKFGAIRSYLIYNSDLPASLLTYTAKNQGPNGRQYIPVISLRTRISGQNHIKYPEVWSGTNDANWKKQFDQIATQYGTSGSPVNGPKGSKAYPVILTFNHEFDLANESGAAYDPNNPLTNAQQFSKAFRYVQDLQRSYKPGLNVKWTWIPTSFKIREYTGTGMNPIFEFWPSRNTNGTGGSIDDGTPNLSNVSRVDIMGCDAYMNEFSFAEALNKGGINSKSSFLNMTKSVGNGTGMHWLLGEWGIDEKCNDSNWKKNAFDDMMTLLATNDYKKGVLIAMWPTGSPANDNRWNSPPKAADGSCPYPWPGAQNAGISAQGFVSHLATGVSLPAGRDNIFGL